MTVGLAGRGVAMVGIILGLLAIALDLISNGSTPARYLDHGVVVVFATVLLSMASYLPAEVGYDTAGAAAGTAVFGFYLYIPGIFAVGDLGALDVAAWLGLGTVLIPIGWAIVRKAEGGHHDSAAPAAAPGSAASARDPLFALAVAGLILMAAGIWLPVVSGDASFWSGSYSGHALGILLLIAVLANAATLLLPLVSSVRVSADGVLLVASASAGLAAAQWLESAFNHLGSLGTGGWVEGIGGLLLVGGVVAMRLAGARSPAPGAIPVTP